jgi:hypothetical protein
MKNSKPARRLAMLVLIWLAPSIIRAQEAKPTIDSAKDLTSKIVRAIYPEVNLDLFDMNVNLDASSGNAENYKFGVAIDKRFLAHSSGKHFLQMTVSVRNGVVASLVTAGDYVSHERWEQARRELATHPEWNNRDVSRMLRARGARFSPPKTVAPSTAERRLSDLFPGLAFGRAKFVYRVAGEPSQPLLLWRLESKKRAGLDQVFVELEPFNGRVYSIQVPAKTP